MDLEALNIVSHRPAQMVSRPTGAYRLLAACVRPSRIVMRFKAKMGFRRVARVEKKRRQRSMTSSAAPIVDSIIRKVTALFAA